MSLNQNIMKKFIPILVVAVALLCSCSGNQKPFFEQLDADVERATRNLFQQTTSDRITVQAEGDTIHSTRIVDIEELNSVLRSNGVRDDVYFYRPYTINFTSSSNVRSVSSVFYFNQQKRIIAFMANDRMYFIPRNFY